MAKKPLSWTEATKNKEFRGHKSKVHCVAWSKDGNKLASGSTDYTARLWYWDQTTLTGGKESLELKGHTDSVDQLCWDPTKNDLLATASADKTVRLWDARGTDIFAFGYKLLAGSASVGKIATSGENINISWSPDGKHIAVGNKDDVVTLIDTRTLKIEKKTQFSFEVNEISWDTTGKHFFLTTGLGTVQILDFESFKPIYTINAHTANCYCIRFDPLKRYFAVGSADALASLWDLEDFTCLRTFSQLDWPVRALSFSHDGEYLASASEDTVIDISRVETGESVLKVPCFAATNTVDWHPFQYLLAYAGDELDRNGRSEGNVRVFGV